MKRLIRDKFIGERGVGCWLYRSPNKNVEKYFTPEQLIDGQLTIDWKPVGEKSAYFWPHIMETDGTLTELEYIG